MLVLGTICNHLEQFGTSSYEVVSSGGDEEELPREANKEDSLSGAGEGALDVTIVILDTVVKCFLSEYIVQTLKNLWKSSLSFYISL